MQRSAIVWGVMLILLGGLLLLDRLGILPFNFWSVVWPLVLIAIGLSIFFGGQGEATAEPSPPTPEQVVMQLKGAESAEISLHLPNGRLTLDSAAPPDELISGTFSGGVTYTAYDLGEGQVEVTLRPKTAADPLAEAQEWRVSLNPDLPLTLRLDQGDGESILDLRAMNIAVLDIRMGRGRAEVTLPAVGGGTTVDVLVDLGAIDLRLPEHIAGYMQRTTTTGTFEVDTRRFPAYGDAYQSTDYETAERWVEITATIGSGHVTVS
jgi:hypothetical protein